MGGQAGAALAALGMTILAVEAAPARFCAGSNPARAASKQRIRSPVTTCGDRALIKVTGL